MLTESEIATASPADLYEFRMTELNRATYGGNVMPLPPFRKVPNPNSFTGESDSRFGTIHEMVVFCLNQVAIDSTVENVAAHNEYLNGFIAGAVFATMSPARDGWTEDQRRTWIHAISAAACAARSLADARHAETKGGAA